MSVKSPLTLLVDGTSLSDGYLLKDPDSELDYGIRLGAADWVTATDYDVNDIVRDPDDGHYYRCVDANTSGASLSADSDAWEELSHRFWLEPGETLVDHDVTIVEKSGTESPALLIKHATLGSSLFTDFQGVTVWLDDGTEGYKYEVTVRVTTSDDRVDDRTFVVKILER